MIETCVTALLHGYRVFGQTPVLAKFKRLGVDFVFPLSQSQSQQPHQNLVHSSRQARSVKFGIKTHIGLIK